MTDSTGTAGSESTSAGGISNNEPSGENKSPSGISIMVGLKTIPQHVNGSCHIHIDVCVTSLPDDIHGQMRVCSACKQWLGTIGSAGLGTTDAGMRWMRTSPVPSRLLLCWLSSLRGQGTGSTLCPVCVQRSTVFSKVS